MAPLILEPTAMASWHRLVTEAAARADVELDEERESYLVFLLMRYLRCPELVRAVLALEFLETLNEPSWRLRAQGLQTVGDRCLLLAGLFPEQARRRRVGPGYFVDLGRSAYDGAAELNAGSASDLLAALAAGFVALADTLQAAREADESHLVDALEAADQAIATGSGEARRRLRRVTRATLVAGSDRRH
ncbi:hypothetical protein [Sediminicurvatus halobius]|uniref:Uncharacterized protein n=1 Tax=Sediminicurvatus halobius TaxID=2182432 RepID=A0A2U2N2E2_9GAMM|nr:hypothetical protein [Spiribacter halobius]PWG63395.1 hypothetical protein DEM34_08790 [Spiribacter halobius]UEX78065.1 hypothetical protein LMH63_00045 [Spiribacter halobius]